MGKGLWRLPGLGHGPTFWLMAFANLLLGAYFWLTGGAGPALRTGTVAQQASVRAATPAAAASGMLIAFAMLSGLVAGALEGDMFKRIAFALQFALVLYAGLECADGLLKVLVSIPGDQPGNDAAQQQAQHQRRYTDLQKNGIDFDASTPSA